MCPIFATNPQWTGISKGVKIIRMKIFESLFHTLRQILAGRRLITNGVKFRILCFAAAFVHLIFCICMGRMDAHILFIYNIFIVYGYICMGIVLTRKHMYRQILVLTFVEIEVHSSLASVLLGLDWEYMLYTVALVPAAFYFANSVRKNDNHLLFALRLAAFVVVVYFAVMIAVPRLTPVYDTSAYGSIKVGISYLNRVIAFGLQFILAFLFALEALYMESLLKDENIRLGEEASFDPLTKLMNRRSLNNSINGELESDPEQVYSVVMVDIDDFKRINDTYGHSVGDNVLMFIANLVKNELRNEDMACRWGGEEFLLYIHGTKEESFFVADRIRDKMSEARFGDKHGNRFGVTVTMGISDNRFEKSFRTVIEEADEKLYLGKRSGKNQVVV